VEHRDSNAEMATDKHHSDTDVDARKEAERRQLAADLLCLSERAAGCITRPMTAVEGNAWLYDEAGLPH